MKDKVKHNENEERDGEKFRIINQLFTGILLKSTDGNIFLVYWIVGNIIIEC